MYGFVQKAVYKKSKLLFPGNNTQPELVTVTGEEDLLIVVEASCPERGDRQLVSVGFGVIAS